MMRIGRNNIEVPYVIPNTSTEIRTRASTLNKNPKSEANPSEVNKSITFTCIFKMRYNLFLKIERHFLLVSIKNIQKISPVNRKSP
jgi:hypothetical protein